MSATATPSARHQRGAALLTAMIIVTLVATLATAMVWQQWRSVQVEGAERARAQAAWILSGALDFAKLILREDKKQYTALNEPWATPLAESRLSTFLAVDKSNADDGPEAFLSGDIADLQSRYNLNNLADKDKQKAAAELAILQRLCNFVSVDPGVAQRIATGLINAADTTNAAAPLQPVTLAQLTWLGIDESSVQALEPFVALLPPGTRINVNTASKEVLLAAVPGLDAENIVQVRQRTPFTDTGTFYTAAKLKPPPTPEVVVRSDYFEVHTRLRLLDRVLVERSQVRRSGATVTVLGRERVASLEQVAN